MIRAIFISIILILSSHSWGLTVERKTSPENITIGQPFIYEIKIIHLPSIKIIEPKIKLEPTVQMVQLTPSISDKNDQRISRFQYKLQVFKAGSLVIPTQSIMLKNKKKPIAIPALPFTVQSLLVSKNATLQPMRNPIQPRLNTLQFILFSLFIILLTAGISAGGWYAHNRYGKKEGETEEAELIDLRSPEERAKDRLAEVLAQGHFEKGEEKVFYEEFSYLIRQYLSDRYSENCLEMTSFEILQILTTQINEQESRRLKKLFELCDWVKFAKWIPEEKTYKEGLEKFKQLMTSLRSEPLSKEDPSP